MSITSEDSSTISLDTPEQNGERGEQVARTRQTNLKRSPLCHGIYDSIATEPREWLDILARLRREHAKMAEPTSSDVISKLMHCAEYNDGLFPPSDELTAVSPMVEATQSKICYRDNTIEVNTSNVNDTCSTNKMQHRTHQPIPFIAVTAVSDATQTMENSHQATGTRRQRSLIPRRSTKRTLVADQKRQPASVQPSSTLFHSIEQPESNAMLLSINDNVPRLHDRQRAKRGLAILSKTAPRRSSPLAHTIASNELPTTNGEKQPPSKLPIWKGHANRRVANNESVRDSAHHHHPCSRDGDNDDVLTQDESDGLARLMNRLTTELAIADREAASIAAGELLKPPSAPFVDDDDDEVRKVCGRGTPPKRWLEGGSLLRDKLTVPALSGDDPEDDLPITVIFDSDSSQHEYFYSPAGIGRTTCSTTTTKINSDNNNMHDDRHGFPRNEMDVRISVDNLLQRCLT
ncbi:hypothetical protein BDF19DRAFT_414398 [Syncephalis fuscata]|nr:hypothetical protein BDF19DRAFT_414398 [Syncephalis fuscata]